MKTVTLTRAIPILSLMIGLSAWAAGPQDKAKPVYTTVTNIPYRSEQGAVADPYMQERCRLDLYYPQDTTNYATLVWFHGGGLQGGSKSILPALKERGIAVVAANYRLFPRATCPAYLDDAAAAVAWTFTNMAAYGGSPSLIFVSGHSAGGYLTSMIGLDKHWLAKYGVDANAIAGLIPLSGQCITHLAIRKERGVSDKQAVVDEFAPLFHARADAPPLLLITGDRTMEMLGRYEENAYLMRMMLINGHTNTTLFELQGFPHGMVEPAVPLLLKFIRQHLPAPVPTKPGI